MDPVTQEREFWRALIAVAAKAGLRGVHMLDLMGRAQTQLQLGAWTDPETFVTKLQEGWPVFFEGATPSAEPSRAVSLEPLGPKPAPGPVSRFAPPGTILLSREDAK